VLDGELYTTDLPFEELAGLIKKRKVTHEDTERLKHVSYHIYDIINDEPFSERYKRLQTILNPPYRYLKIVPTTIVSSIPEFREQFKDFVAHGMEGIMLRNMSGIYRCNYRSNDLQKYKEFFEEEYKIIGFKDGDGRDKGAVIWECACGDNSFWVRPRGTMEKRQEWFRDGLSYVGKMITVIYQELSDMGIPRFPVGKSIRDGF
jgi:ATP-dependent DNA ligase